MYRFCASAALFLLLVACANPESKSGMIWDQFTREDFNGITNRRDFIDYLYTHSNDMKDTKEATLLCLARHYEDHMTPRYLQAIDVFVADHSVPNWEQVVHVHNSERSIYPQDEVTKDVKECVSQNGL